MIGLEQSLGLWIPQVTGRYINEDWNAENEGFGAQCWDAAANWSRYLGLPVISTGGEGRWPGWAGNMIDAFPQSPEIAAAYELIGPDEPGLPGDIAVWGDGYYYYPKTHVAVLVRDLDAQLLCISQNSSASRPDNPYPQWTTGPTILQHLPRRGLIGFIRPRTGAGIAAMGETTTPLSEEDDMALPADFENEWAVMKEQMASLVTNVATKADVPTKAQNEFTQAALVSLVNNVATKADLSGVSAAVVSAAQSGASKDEIRAAVDAAMAAGLKVDVTVNGGK